MSSELGITAHPPADSEAPDGRPAFRIPNSEFRIHTIWIAVAVAFLQFLVGVSASEAKLAVFVDGRVLKVEDAYLEGNRIILELPGDGTLEVPATRIDRVIADEIAADDEAEPSEPSDCPAAWEAIQLPSNLPFRNAIMKVSKEADLHPWLVAAVVQTESAFDPFARSRAGACGLMQLMPAAAADHHVRDVFDPMDNLRGGAAHLRAMLDRFQSLSLALAAYNAGATTVDRYEGVPPYRETRHYVRRILELFCPAPPSDG